MLVGGVFGEHLARGSGLEGLEARLALDRLRSRVLHFVRNAPRYECRIVTHRLQLTLRLLGTAVFGAIALLLCPVKMLVPRHRVCAIVTRTWLRYPCWRLVADELFGQFVSVVNAF